MQQMTVLIVDDHADSARAAAVLLRRDGHAVTIAEGVADALAKAAAMGSIDVLVSDISLRDGDGCSLLRMLYERVAGVPRLAIAVTGHTDPHWAEECRRAGYHRFLVKPFMPSDLLDAVRELPEVIPTLGGVPAAVVSAAMPSRA